MADKIVVLNGGHIEQVGTPLDLYNTPVNQFVTGFIGSPKVNFLAARVESHDSGRPLLRTGDQVVRLPRQIDLATGTDVTLGVRPEHLEHREDGGILLSHATITLIENLGGETVVYARLPDGQPLTMALDGQQKVVIGQEIPVSVDSRFLHVFDGAGLAI